MCWAVFRQRRGHGDCDTMLRAVPFQSILIRGKFGVQQENCRTSICVCLRLCERALDTEYYNVHIHTITSLSKASGSSVCAQDAIDAAMIPLLSSVRNRAMVLLPGCGGDVDLSGGGEACEGAGCRELRTKVLREFCSFDLPPNSFQITVINNPFNMFMYSLECMCECTLAVI